jgi:hypothetical protein
MQYIFQSNCFITCLNKYLIAAKMQLITRSKIAGVLIKI